MSRSYTYSEAGIKDPSIWGNHPGGTFTTAKRASRENAYITNGENIVKGDSLFYNRNLGYGKAINNISLIDTINNILVNGDLSCRFFSFT